MKVLFGVDSFFQLIVAINLKMCVYAKDSADIIIYSSTPNADRVCRKLEKTKIFERCFFANTVLTRCGGSYSFKEKFPKYFVYLKSLIKPKQCIRKIIGTDDLNYDVFLFNGIGALPECIFNCCKKNNNNIICYRFEDGYISSTLNYGSEKGIFRIAFEKIIRGLFKNYNIEYSIKGYYFMEPELVKYKFNYPVLKAPKLNRDNKEIIKVLNYIFDYNAAENTYNEKYIFLESGSTFFYNSDSDIDVQYVKDLLKLVGKENILVKLHPRSKINRFSKLGVHVVEKSSVPWELIQLNNHFDDKILIAIDSSPILTSHVYFNDKCKSILLYKAINNYKLAGENLEQYIAEFIKKYSSDKLYIPENIEQFKKIINQMKD